MLKLLKWVGLAALISLPIVLIVRKLQAEEAEIELEDEFDIFAEE